MGLPNMLWRVFVTKGPVSYLGSFILKFCFGKLYVEVLFWEALC